MPYKPIPPKEFKKYLGLVGWTLEKGGIDWSVFDEQGKFVCTIRITHGNTKSEVPAYDVRKIEKEFKERGWLWPPRKKSKSN